MIQHIYDEMWENFSSGLILNQYQLDPNIHSSNDTRRGITALAYLHTNNQSVSQAIDSFAKQVSLIEPQQYYHPIDELHLTLLAIISCVAGFELSQIDSRRYSDIFNDVMASSEPITIHFRGITASASCIVVQGFPADSALNDLRAKFRAAFKRSGLRTSIDSRYELVIAHTSVVRFCAPLQNSQQLLELCKRYKNYDFGSVVLRDIELVFNNWYQNLSCTHSLAQHVMDKQTAQL
ncbi:hypothetical protein DBZ36_12935 [Alginatibacterium sediminis]|uniref:Mutarotase n=1 Tax=Alginatibacterium sediminis TaxID=2164068 RepID=A0A420EBU5_9ALTE|nr:hypothetical protein [Alginatibacterium sediminis]RKF18134.1 hypothetical protein DBZ36_12935 [Alginatibacterium sediminis]